MTLLTAFGHRDLIRKFSDPGLHRKVDFKRRASAGRAALDTVLSLVRWFAFEDLKLDGQISRPFKQRRLMI
jgi:hypothetical protein